MFPVTLCEQKTLDLPIRGLSRADWQLIQPIRKLTEVIKLLWAEQRGGNTTVTNQSHNWQPSWPITKPLIHFPHFLSLPPPHPKRGEVAREERKKWNSSSLLKTCCSRGVFTEQLHRHKQQLTGFSSLPLRLQPTLNCDWQSDSETHSPNTSFTAFSHEDRFTAAGRHPSPSPHMLGLVRTAAQIQVSWFYHMHCVHISEEVKQIWFFVLLVLMVCMCAPQTVKSALMILDLSH